MHSPPGTPLSRPPFSLSNQANRTTIVIHYLLASYGVPLAAICHQNKVISAGLFDKITCSCDFSELTLIMDGLQQAIHTPGDKGAYENECLSSRNRNHRRRFQDLRRGGAH